MSKFDQVVQGNIDIKQLSKNKYRITFSKIRKFLLYQTWSDSSQQLNENRKVFYQNAKQWIQSFNNLNASLKVSSKPLFTPTVVMKIGNNNYLFVIHKAKFDGKGRVVFKVSTNEIKLSEKKMLKLPRGHHDGVRFDIDSVQSTLVYTVNTSNNDQSFIEIGINAAPSVTVPPYQLFYLYFDNVQQTILSSSSNVIVNVGSKQFNFTVIPDPSIDLNLVFLNNNNFNNSNTYPQINASEFIQSLVTLLKEQNIPKNAYKVNYAELSSLNYAPGQITIDV
jgi:hypothetical protein